MGLWKKIKDWLKGDDEYKKKVNEANRINNGGGTSTKKTKEVIKKSADTAKKKKKTQTQTQTQTSNAFSNQSIHKAEQRDKQTSKTVEKAKSKPKKKDTGGTSDPFNTKNAFKAKKAKPPEIKHHSTALGTLSKDEIADRKVSRMNAARKDYLASKYEPKVKEKYGGATQASKIARKQGEWQYDPDVAKYETLKHPVVTSAARGATAGATFGLSELAAKKAKRNNGMDKAEKVYQAYKDPTAERLGELGGSFASFGLTSGATEKLGAKLASKVAPKAAEKLAEKSIVKGLAEHSAKKLTGEASAELAKQIGIDRAKKIVNTLGGEVVQNLTTGAVYDVANASREYEPFSKEWWGELGKSAAFNAAITTGIAGGSIIGGNKQLVSDAFDTVNKRRAVQSKLDDIAHTSKAGDVMPSKTTLPKIGESIEDRIARMDAERLGKSKLPETKAELPEAKAVLEEPKAKAVLEELKAEEPKKALTTEERLAKMKTEAGEKNDAIRAELAGEKQTDAIRRELGIETPTAETPRTETPTMGTVGKASKETDGLKAYEESLKKPVTVEVTNKNGKTRKVTVEAKSESEALEIASNGKNVKSARIAESATDVKPKTTMPKQKQTVNLGDMVNKEREEKTFRDSFRELKESARTKFFDSLTPFDDAARKKAKTDFNGMLDDLAASDKVRRHHNIASKSIENGQLKWSDGKQFSGTHTVDINGNTVEIANGKSLNSIFDGMDKETENEFNQYLLLRHAPDRLAQNKPIFDAMELKGGLDLNDPEVCLAEAKKLADKHPEFEVKAEELYQYNRNELQNRVDAGLLKQEVADEWNATYPHYVPTGREVGFDGEYDIWDIAGQLRNEGNTVGASPIKKATGGSSPIRSIKEQISEATTRNWRDMSMNNLFRRQFGDKIGKELAVYADGGVEKVLDNTLNLSKTKGGKYFAEVFENGDMHRIEIDKRFYDAIEDLYKNGKFGNALDIANDAFSKPSHLFKKLVTSWNPIFMVKNGLRDMSEAIINTRQTKEFLSILASGDALDDLARNGEFTQALERTGVLQSSNLVNAREALLKEEGNAVGKFIKKRANNFAALQEMVETYPRLVEFMATIRKAGYNSLSEIPASEYANLIDRAALNAADVTVNFGRSGSVSKALNRGVVPFFNPSVQGFSKFVRNFSEQKSVAATLDMILKATALGASATAINNYLLQDNPNYQQISARDKANNYIIPFAKANWEHFDGKNQIPILPLTEDSTYEQADTFIKIPKSRFASVYSLPTVNLNNENDMPWAEMIKVAYDQVGVVDPMQSSIFAPFIQAAKNETWYGTPIVPKAVENKTNPWKEYDENTSPFGVALGKATSKLPKEFQISPKKADYVIDAETGVVGDFLLPASTAWRNGNSPLDAMGKVAKKAFTIDSVTQNDLSSRFYDKLQEASDNNEGGETEKAEYDRMNAYSTQISGINKAIKELQNGNLKMNQEDIRELQKVRNELYNDALKGKEVPSETKVMNAVQEHVGTTFAVDNFGTAADKDAMKIYGKSKYGDLSDEKMKQKIDADKDFYKGVKAIHDVGDKMTKAEIESDTTLTKAIALASASADDDLFGAYGCSNKGRNESASKMERARTYFKDGGSVDEYVKLEKTRKTVGRKTGGQKDAELEALENQLENGQITEDEYYSMAGELDYNPNTSYLGKAISFAQANSPERGYRLYDIKDANIQKGINLAAMGYSSGDVRDMKRAMDSDGNGYLKKQEIMDYIDNSDVKDKATLFAALYNGKYNPYGTPTKYTRAQAAEEGKKQGVEWITDETDDIEVQEEESGGGSGYYRRGWGRYHRRGRKKKAKAPSTKIDSAFTSDDDGRLSGRVSTSATKRRVKIKSASGGYNGSVVKNVSTYSGSYPKPKSSSGSSSGVVRKVSTSNPRVSSSRTKASTPRSISTTTRAKTHTSTPRSSSKRVTTSTPRVTRSSTKAPTVKTASAESFYRGTSAKSSVSTKTANVRTANNIARTEARMSASPTMKKTALKVKNVKAPSKKKANLSAALEDIKKTQKKVAPPKRRK